MINTKKPGNEKESKIKVSAESGFRGTGINYYAMGSFTTPLIEDVLSAKLAFYHNNDGGWHKNILPGSDIENRVAQAGGLAADLLRVDYQLQKIQQTVLKILENLKLLCLDHLCIGHHQIILKLL